MNSAYMENTFIGFVFYVLFVTIIVIYKLIQTM